MRRAVSIAARDVRAVFASAFGYGLAAGFLALAGALLVLDLRDDQARLDGWFGPLFVVLGVLAPLLTMRSFAEEERAGSLELLLTTPLTTTQVVAGKVAGVTGVLAVLIAATVVCPLLVASMGNPDVGPILTGYVGLLLVGLAFVCIGLATSAATSSQLVAGASSAALVLALWFAGLLGGGLTGRPRAVLDHISPSGHVVGFLRGTVAVADVVYFLSVALLASVVAGVLLRGRR